MRGTLVSQTWTPCDHKGVTFSRRSQFPAHVSLFFLDYLRAEGQSASILIKNQTREMYALFDTKSIQEKNLLALQSREVVRTIVTSPSPPTNVFRSQILL